MFNTTDQIMKHKAGLLNPCRGIRQLIKSLAGHSTYSIATISD